MKKIANNFSTCKKIDRDITPEHSHNHLRHKKIAQTYPLQMQKKACSKNKYICQSPNLHFTTLKRYLSEKILGKQVHQVDSPMHYIFNKPELCDIQQEDRRITMPILSKKQSKERLEKSSTNLFLKKKPDNHNNIIYLQKSEIVQQQDQSNKPKELKDTTSTSSADFVPKPQIFIPSFLKLKKNEKKIMNTEQKSHFRQIKLLGKGKFGEVFLVKDIRTNYLMAMKVFEKAKIIKGNFLEQFIRQLKIQTYLNHPSIVKMYGFFYDEKKFYVLLELGCDGQLYSLLQKKTVLSEQATSYIINSLLQALTYIHKFKIIHRDIKPQNIVLIHGFPKICDFGWAVHNSNDFRDTYCGTPLYFSPQLLRRNCYDNKIDIWAIGILAYELRLGTSPFDIQSQQDLHKIITDSVKFPIKGTSSRFREFILAILKKNPNERLTCQQLLKYPFITQYQGLQACQQLI